MQKSQNLPKSNETGNRFTGASDDPILEGQLHALLTSLYALYHTEIDLGLTRTYRFLEQLGNPHLHLPPVVHIAGTNGKGSTTATLRSLLEASGHTVHVYTSPHLMHPTERIRLAGSPITSRALFDVLTECIEINQDAPITFFELFTCAAFLAFSRTPADYLLLETGMGGRLDTTNVVPNPICTIITTISHDHMAFLGDSLDKIAFEKAGIMKAGAPCVVGYQFDEAVQAGVMDVFHKKSQDLSPAAPLHVFGAQWVSASESGMMLFRNGDDSILLPKPCLAGSHQIWNAGAALEAFRIIAPAHFQSEILSTAMGNIDWPARLQTLVNHPLNRVLPEGWHLVLDGGHNDSAGLVLAAQMKEWEETDEKPLHLVVGMMARKDAAAFLRPLKPHVRSITLIDMVDEAGAFAKEDLANVAQSLGFSNILTAVDAGEALSSLAKAHTYGGPSRVLITGSLFLAGKVLGK